MNFIFLILPTLSSLQTLKTPRLVEDDTEPVWSRTTQMIPLKNMKRRVTDIVAGLYDYLEDPRIGPILLLGALISLGTIWLRRSLQVHQTKSNDSNQPSSEVNVGLIYLYTF